MAHKVSSDLVKEIRMNGCHQMKGDMIRWLNNNPQASALDLVKHFCGTIWMSGSLEDGRFKEGQNYTP